MFSIAIARCGWCGMTTHLTIDNRYEYVDVVACELDDQPYSIPIDVDPFVITNAGGVVAQVYDNGVSWMESTVSTQVVWSTSVPGVYELQHQVVLDGEVVGETQNFKVELWSPRIEIGCDGYAESTMRQRFPTTYGEIEEIVLREGMIQIPDGFAEGCDSLQYISIPSTITDFGDNDFREIGAAMGESGYWIQNGWLLGYIGEAPCEVVIPDGVVGIAGYAFEGQLGIESISFPESLRYIGVATFEGCVNLEKIELPEGIERVDDRAFKDCTWVDQIEFPESLRVIGRAAFENCANIYPGIVIPEGVKTIDAYAFSNCWRVVSVSLPFSLDAVGTGAFTECRRITGATVPTHVEPMAAMFPSAYANLNAIAIVEGETNMVIGIFKDCVSLPQLSIPDTITAIPDRAFNGCTGLEKVIYPDGIFSIGDEVYVGCANMLTPILPDTVETIGAQAFYGLSQFTKFDFPASLKSIGNEAFRGCSGLSAIALPDGLESLGEKAFYGVNKLTSVDIPATVTAIGDAAFGGCASIRIVSFPGGIKTASAIFPQSYTSLSSATITDGSPELCANLFYNCTKLAAVEIPTSVTNICDYAFRNCSSLTAVGIPSGVVSLGTGAFQGCSSITSLSLPQGLTTLNDDTFNGCSSLMELVIPGSVEAIGARVFSGCSAMTMVSYVGNAPVYDQAAYSGAANTMVSRVIKGTTGWDGVTGSKAIPETWPTANARSIEYWDADEFEVVFNGNGGEPALNSVAQISGLTYSLPLVDPTRNGMRFAGWWTETENGAQIKVTSKVTATRTHTLYAHWTPNEYAIRFVGGEGTIGEMGEVAMTCGTAKTLTANSFRKVDADFVGWATEDGGEAVYTDGEDVVDLTFENGALVTLYAVWTERIWSAGDYIAEGEWEFAADVANDADWVPDTVKYVSAPGSMRSGAIGAGEDGARTYSTMTAKIVGEGTGSFKWAVDCEEPYLEAGDWYDYVVFTVDGAEVAKIAGVVDWTSVEFEVTGAGEHTLAWTFTRDDYDEDGADYENAAWVDDFVFTRTPVTLSFAAGEGTDGETPATITLYAGAEVTLPGVGSMKNGYSVFGGWTDGENVYSAGAKYVFGLSDVTLTAVWSEHEWTPEEILGVTNLVLTMGGDLDWVADFATNHDGFVSMRSGAIGDSQSTYIEAAFEGAGELSFWWKVSGQVNGSRYYDYAKVELDGAEVYRAGNVDWTSLVISVANSGSHTIRWTYLKNASGSYGYDAAWLDDVIWKPSVVQVDPIPELPDNPSTADVREALDGSADTALRENITEPAVYDAYRTWAESVKDTSGAAVAGQQMVKNSSHAWLSFALGTESLIAEAPAEGDIKINNFEPSETSGKYDFEVSIEDVSVGNGATEENIKKVFGIEGSTALGDDTKPFSTDNVGITLAEPKDGKIKFTAGPTDTTATSFFMKVKMK